MPSGWHGVFEAIATSGVVFSYLGFRQGIEFAGETDNPQAQRPASRWSGSVLITGIIYVALQFAFIGALDPGDPRRQQGLVGAVLRERLRAARRDRLADRAGLAGRRAVRRRDHLPRRHRPDLHHRDLADLLCDGPERQRPAGPGPHHRPRRTADQPDRHLRGRAHRVPAVPELAAAGRLHHLGHRAVVRHRPAGARCAAPGAARGGAPVQGPRRARHPGAGVLGGQPDHLLVDLAHQLEALRRRADRLRAAAGLPPARQGRPRPRLALGRHVGAAVAGRPGADLLPGQLRRPRRADLRDGGADHLRVLVRDLRPGRALAPGHRGDRAAHRELQEGVRPGGAGARGRR